WMVGTFHGYSPKYRVYQEIQISSRGDVTVYSKGRDGNVTRTTGVYRDARIYIENRSYHPQPTGNGFRITQVEDSDNKVDYRRGPSSQIDTGEGGNGGGDRANGQRPPSWLVGRFRGYNRKYRVDVELDITRRGEVTSNNRYDSGKRETETGYYRDGKLF